MSRDKFVDDLASNGNLFSQENLRLQLLSNPRVSYYKRDFVFRSGEWRGEHQPALIRNFEADKLVIGHSDLSWSSWHSSAFKLFSGSKTRIWVSNLTHGPQTPGTQSIPLGLPNATRESRAHEICGNQNHISEALSEEAFREPRLYANFSPSTSPKHRAQLRDIIEDSSFIVTDRVDLSHLGRIEYLRKMRKHGFVICPRGNGQDTHRLFEAMCVGATPVLLTKEAPRWLMNRPEIPKILLKEWNELSNLEGNLMEQILQNQEPDYLSTSYWVKEVNSDESRSAS